MLPWWWYHYALHNDTPVAFCDLGLSVEAKEWCQKKGVLVTPSLSDFHDQHHIPQERAVLWERVIGSGIWNVRRFWMQKPFLFSMTPFSYTLWMDLDCEVRTSIDALSTLARAGMALAEEPPLLQEGFRALGLLEPQETLYNSGVVPFSKESPLLALWQQEVSDRSHHYIGDQEALSHMLFAQNKKISTLSNLYNWDRALGSNRAAHIFHWHGQKGKECIVKELEHLRALSFLDL